MVSLKIMDNPIIFIAELIGTIAFASSGAMMGIKKNGFSQMLDDYKPQIGRMEEFDLGKPVILNLAKNPAGFNQAIQTVLQDERKKDIIVAIIKLTKYRDIILID